MPTNNWLRAARQENRQPVILMQIEDSAADEILYTTRSDWEGSTTLTNIDTTSQVGDAIGQRHDNAVDDTDSGGTTFIKARSTYTPSIDGYLREFIQNSFIFGSASDQSGSNEREPAGYKTVTLTIRTTSHGGTVVYSGTSVAYFYLTLVGAGFGSTDANYTAVSFNYLPFLGMSNATTYYVEVSLSGLAIPYDDGVPQSFSVSSDTSSLLYTPEASTDCTLTTSTIDLGSVPVSPAVLSIDDTLESGASIIYTAFGGPADPPVNNLGTVEDGDSLTAYRYYRIQADISSTTGGRGIVKQFGLREGLFKWYGTEKDIPFRGVQPYLQLGGFGNLSTAIKLDKGISTTGQISAVLKWTADTSDFIASRFLRGKDVQMLYGFKGLAQSDYEPFFTGTWFDYSFNDEARTITVKVQDILKQFEKIKLPTESYNASGVKTSTDIVYTKANGVTTITDIYDELGIRDRYISPEYATLSAGDLSGTDYNVTRTLSKPIEAFKLLDQLAQTLGLFLVPQGDGELFPYLFDDTAAADYTIDASKFTPSGVAGNQDEIATRQYAYYNITDSSESDPNSEDKFDNAYQLINVGAESKWENEETQKLFFDKWRVGNNETDPLVDDVASPPQALIDLANRWNGWYSDPKITVTISSLPPEWMKATPTSIIEINNLDVPVSNQPWLNSVDYAVDDIRINGGKQYIALAISGPSTSVVEPGVTGGWETSWEYMNILDTGLTDGMKFITMKRSINIAKGIVSLEVRQI